MLRKLDDKQRKRIHRKFHIRKKIHGTANRPRMTVTRSNKNLFVQVINDDEGKTLAAIS
ncbi:MAG: 50S ribosomal protein L18, partial [Treponema sp.]|nr:50S ribosomal protein L18 [Treponema sp.]